MSSKSTKMGLGSLVVLVTTCMMGAGIFMLPASLAAIGSVSVFGWVISTIGSVALAITYSKLAFMCPKEGGLYAYTRDGLGEFAAFTETWCYWLTLWIANIAIAVSGIGYLSYFFPMLKDPVAGGIAAILSIWFFTFLNYPGASFIGKIQRFSILGVALPVGCMALLGWFFFHPSYISANWNISGKSDWTAIMSATSLTMWAYLGFEAACVVSGVVENPKRNVPLATMIGTIFAALLYIGATLAIMGVVPAKQLAASAAPFGLAFQTMFGNWAGSFVSVCAIVASFACLNSWVLTTGQVQKAIADDGMFPKFFAKTNKFGTPFVGMLVTAVLMTIVGYISISPSLASEFQVISLLCVFTNVVPYLLAAAAIFPIMKANKVVGKEYVTYTTICIIGLIFGFYVIAGSGQPAVFYGSLTMLLSIPLFAWISHSIGKRRAAESLAEAQAILDTPQN
ncbi:MAG: amino acid permease [Paludibacterium sp.]|uniref:amino acid permease n=1 Tax=Paludibacterium sp. TaxID=1917523 RepID=UPI0025CD7DE5|nr:amino acid permease [Paludibacterium sp.]MBV8046496.1 amino acid permease [Paludibacterium sp.]MBV8646550.1 amino acid permease [Paludibacterium sp.]